MTEPCSKLGTVVVHYGGLFLENPFRYYDSALVTMGEVKFHMLNYKSFSKYVIKITNSSASVGMYYCKPDKDLSKGLCYMKCEEDFRRFVKYANANDGLIHLYLATSKIDLSSIIDDRESDNESDDEFWDWIINDVMNEAGEEEMNDIFNDEQAAGKVKEIKNENVIENDSAETECSSIGHLNVNDGTNGGRGGAVNLTGGISAGSGKAGI